MPRSTGGRGCRAARTAASASSSATDNPSSGRSPAIRRRRSSRLASHAAVSWATPQCARQRPAPPYPGVLDVAQGHLVADPAADGQQRHLGVGGGEQLRRLLGRQRRETGHDWSGVRDPGSGGARGLSAERDRQRVDDLGPRSPSAGRGAAVGVGEPVVELGVGAGGDGEGRQPSRGVAAAGQAASSAG